MVRRVRTAIDEHDWIVIDCPPGITRVNADAIRVADVVLIPCKPRVWDAWACEDIVAAVKLRQDANRGDPSKRWPPTRNMRQEEASGGFYHSEMWQGNYPKIQIRTINQLLDGHGFELPPRQSAYQAAPRVRRPEGQQATLEEMTG